MIQTNDSQTPVHDALHHHSPELAVAGKYLTSDIGTNATAHDMQVRHSHAGTQSRSHES